MKWLHNLIKGIYLTGALFAFQACYGTVRAPEDYGGETDMTFSLVSAKTGAPIEGVKISTSLTEETYNNYGGTEAGVTDSDGKCTVTLYYRRSLESPYIHFDGPDGLYFPKDTTLADLRERTVVVKLNPME